eukprot:g2966.t1
MNLSVCVSVLVLLLWVYGVVAEQITGVHPLSDLVAGWLQGRADPLVAVGLDRELMQKLGDSQWRQALEISTERVMDRAPDRAAEIQTAFLLLADANSRAAFFQRRDAIAFTVRGLLAVASLLSGALLCFFFRVSYVHAVRLQERAGGSSSYQGTTPGVGVGRSTPRSSSSAQHHPAALGAMRHLDSNAPPGQEADRWARFFNLVESGRAASSGASRHSLFDPVWEWGGACLGVGQKLALLCGVYAPAMLLRSLTKRQTNASPPAAQQSRERASSKSTAADAALVEKPLAEQLMDLFERELLTRQPWGKPGANPPAADSTLAQLLQKQLRHAEHRFPVFLYLSEAETPRVGLKITQKKGPLEQRFFVTEVSSQRAPRLGSTLLAHENIGMASGGFSENDCGHLGGVYRLGGAVESGLESESGSEGSDTCSRRALPGAELRARQQTAAATGPTYPGQGLAMSPNSPTDDSFQSVGGVLSPTALSTPTANFYNSSDRSVVPGYSSKAITCYHRSLDAAREPNGDWLSKYVWPGDEIAEINGRLCDRKEVLEDAFRLDSNNRKLVVLHLRRALVGHPHVAPFFYCVRAKPPFGLSLTANTGDASDTLRLVKIDFSVVANSGGADVGEETNENDEELDYTSEDSAKGDDGEQSKARLRSRVNLRPRAPLRKSGAFLAPGRGGMKTSPFSVCRPGDRLVLLDDGTSGAVNMLQRLKAASAPPGEEVRFTFVRGLPWVDVAEQRKISLDVNPNINSGYQNDFSKQLGGVSTTSTNSGVFLGLKLGRCWGCNPESEGLYVEPRFQQLHRSSELVNAPAAAAERRNDPSEVGAASSGTTRGGSGTTPAATTTPPTLTGFSRFSSLRRKSLEKVIEFHNRLLFGEECGGDVIQVPACERDVVTQVLRAGYVSQIYPGIVAANMVLTKVNGESDPERFSTQLKSCATLEFRVPWQRDVGQAAVAPRKRGRKRATVGEEGGEAPVGEKGERPSAAKKGAARQLSSAFMKARAQVFEKGASVPNVEILKRNVGALESTAEEKTTTSSKTAGSAGGAAKVRLKSPIKAARGSGAARGVVGPRTWKEDDRLFHVDNKRASKDSADAEDEDSGGFLSADHSEEGIGQPPAAAVPLSADRMELLLRSRFNKFSALLAALAFVSLAFVCVGAAARCDRLGQFEIPPNSNQIQPGVLQYRYLRFLENVSRIPPLEEVFFVLESLKRNETFAKSAEQLCPGAIATTHVLAAAVYLFRGQGNADVKKHLHAAEALAKAAEERWAVSSGEKAVEAASAAVFPGWPYAEALAYFAEEEKKLFSAESQSLQRRKDGLLREGELVSESPDAGSSGSGTLEPTTAGLVVPSSTYTNQRYAADGSKMLHLDVLICHCRENLDWVLGPDFRLAPNLPNVHVTLLVYDKCQTPIGRTWE